MKKTLAITFAAFAATLASMGGTAAASVTCDYVAAPNGSDAASGSVSAPFQTAQKLVDSLAPGQVGCLRAGNYNEDVTISHGGTAGAPVTLTSYPGETATISGRTWVSQTGNDVIVTGLHLIGVNALNLPSPTIDANNVTFSYDEVTDDHTGICFAVGSQGWGAADSTLITMDRIHDCGVLPAGNHDHGIYVDDATNTQISWNVIYDNADRGIQLYPNAQYTTIDHNVIADNGEGILFSGDDGTASSNANVYDNVVTGAVIRHDVESWYPSGNPVGTGNSFHNNCVWGGAEGTIDTSAGGFTAQDNTVANPGYVNPGAADFRLAVNSPCLAVVGLPATGTAGGPSAHIARSRVSTAASRRAARRRAARKAARRRTAREAARASRRAARLSH